MFFIIFMLLMCFAFIYSAACAVMEPRRSHTPDGQRTQPGSVLHESPNTILIKRGGRSRWRMPAVEQATGTRACTQYLVYAALHPKEGSSEHMTLCRTIISEAQCEELSMRLCSCSRGSFEMIAETSRFFIPCDIGIVQRRDPVTGIVSPSRHLETAFNNSGPTILSWIEAAEELTGPRTVSELLEVLIHDTQLCHRPFGHTQSSAVNERRSEKNYRMCCVEITEVSKVKIKRMRAKQHNTQSNLESWLSKTRRYLDLIEALLVSPIHLQSLEGVLMKVPMEDRVRPTDAEVFKYVEDIIRTRRDIDHLILSESPIVDNMCELIKSRKPISIESSLKYYDSLKRLSCIAAFFDHNRKLHDELMQDELLKGAFITIPSGQMNECLKRCHRVACLWLEALQRETALESSI